MIIGVIGAMAEEIALLKESLHELRVEERQGISFFCGSWGAHQVVLVQSGIGKVNATLSVAFLRIYFQVDCIINTGTAGAVDPGIEVGDIVIANALRHHDADVTGFGYEIGQMAGMPAAYYPDTELMRLAQEVCRQQEIEPVLGQIVSGDQFVDSVEEIKGIQAHFPQTRACEMESAAIAQASYVLNIPCLIIRVISDNANGEAPMTFDKFIELVSPISARIVLGVIEQLAS